MTEAVTQPILITLTTLCTVIMIGVGFLPRPCREAAIWSIAFICAMVASYVAAAGTQSGLPLLRALAAGFVLGALALFWVGLRVRAGRRRVFLLPSVVGGLLATAGLAVVDGLAGPEAFERTALAVAVALLVTTAIEAIVLRSAPLMATAPFALASVLCAGFAGVWIVSGLLQPVGAAALACVAPDTVLTDAAAMSVIYLVSALVSALLLGRDGGVCAEPAGTTDFARVAQERLVRAERRGDTWWALLDIRLDDPVALREASNTLAFGRVVERFADDVVLALPAEADIHQVDATRFVVLLPRHDPAVRPVVRDILDRVSTVEAHQSIAVRLSASIGWASVSTCGYDLDVLTRTASGAADDAQLAGGDRWQHAVAAF